MPPRNAAAAPGQKDSAAAAQKKASALAAATSASAKEAQEAPAPGQGSRSKPDQAAYQKEQDEIKKDIDALQAKLSAVRTKISGFSSTGPAQERRQALRSELDELRGQQAANKGSRGKILDQIRALQDGVQKKIKDLQAAKSKAPFKSVEEVDAQIKHLDRQVESGSLRLADEKRALQEISNLKRSRKTVESFAAQQSSIDADKAQLDTLRASLDDPASKTVSDRFDAIKAELDSIKAEGDKAYQGRQVLFDERNALSAQIDALYQKRRDASAAYRAANDAYWLKINEDRARRAERAKAQKEAEEAEKRNEIAERLREEAKAPAYEVEIEDCSTLIDYFSRLSGLGPTARADDPLLRSNVSSVAAPEVRKVETDFAGGVRLKKKGEDEEDYFVGYSKKGKKGGKKGGAKPAAATDGEAAVAPSGSTPLQVPLATLSALLKLSIPPPLSHGDLPKTIESLQMKKAWFAANNERVTRENVAKAEKEIAKLERRGKGDTNGAAAEEVPAEPKADEAEPAAEEPKAAEETAEEGEEKTE